MCERGGIIMVIIMVVIPTIITGIAIGYIMTNLDFFAKVIIGNGKVVEYNVTNQAPHGGDVKLAKTVEVDPEAVMNVLRRAGVGGKPLGT
ncbi:MAG: hypothetical protein ACK4SY_10275 [Pyrobaculum sp.]